MEAIILAGGLGTRLRAVVSDLPKPMAPIDGKPFLAHQIRYWKSQGIHRFILSVGYQWEKIQAHFGNEFDGIAIDYVIEQKPLGTGGGVLLAAEHLKKREPFLLLNGDTLFQVDLSRLKNFHDEKGADITLAIACVGKNNRYGRVILDEAGRILDLKSEPGDRSRIGTKASAPLRGSSPRSYVNGGVYLIEPKVLSTGRPFPFERAPVKAMSLEDALIPELIQAGAKVFGLVSTGPFVDIGVPSDYFRAHRMLKNSDTRSSDAGRGVRAVPTEKAGCLAYKILITGGAGYIGSVLVPELLARGAKVTVVDNFMYGQSSLNSVCYERDFQVVGGDVRDEKLMSSLLKDKDIIIPLAALVGAPLCAKDPMAATAVNREALIGMYKKLGRNQWVLMPTTNSAYGTANGNDVCTEETPLKPISLYAKDKVEVERVLMDRANAISFRLATVFGMSPRMRIDLLVNDFTYRAVYDRFVVLFESSFRRNYIHVRDVVRAFLFGIENFEKMRGQIYNVGLSDANLSKRELCVAIQDHVPEFVFLDAPVGKDPDKRNYIVSNEKIERAGFRPIHSLDTGIGELIKGYAMIKNTKYGNM